MDTFIAPPHVREGSPAQNAARIRAPVLLLHGHLDGNVGIGESRLMAARHRAAGAAPQLIEDKSLDHYLDDDAARTDLPGNADALCGRR